MLRSRESGGRRGGKGVRYEIVDRRRVSGPKPLACLSHLVARYREGTEACPRTSCSRLLPLDEREKGKGLRQKPARDFFFSLSSFPSTTTCPRSHLADRAGLPWGGLLGGGLLLAAPQDHGGGILLGDHLVHRAPVRLGRRSAFARVCRGCLPRHPIARRTSPDLATHPVRITKDFYSTPEPQLNLIPRAGDENGKILMNSHRIWRKLPADLGIRNGQRLRAWEASRGYGNGTEKKNVNR